MHCMAFLSGKAAPCTNCLLCHSCSACCVHCGVPSARNCLGPWKSQIEVPTRFALFLSRGRSPLIPLLLLGIINTSNEKAKLLTLLSPERSIFLLQRGWRSKTQIKVSSDLDGCEKLKEKCQKQTFVHSFFLLCDHPAQILDLKS